MALVEDQALVERAVPKGGLIRRLMTLLRGCPLYGASAIGRAGFLELAEQHPFMTAHTRLAPATG